MADENVTILNGEYVEELRVNGHKASTEVAIRDGRGHIISDYYLPKTRSQEKLVSGINIATINGQPLNGPYNYELRTVEDSYTKTQIDYKLTSKLELIKVASLPSRDINMTAIYMINSTKELYIYSNEWVKIGLSLPATPAEAGTYALLCTVDNNGLASYSWGEANATPSGGNDQPEEPPQARELTRITINRTPTKTAYILGEEFDSEGLSVIAYYTGILRGENVTESVVLSEPNMSVSGEQTITVSYTENGITVSAEFTITIELPTIVFNDQIQDGEFSHTFTFTEGSNGDGTSNIEYLASTYPGEYPVIDAWTDPETGNTVTINALSKVYLECAHGVKLGTSSAKGSLSIDITDSQGQPAALNIQTIKINTFKYNKDSVELDLSAEVSGYNVPTQRTATAGGDAETGEANSTLPFGYPTSYMKLETSSKRIFIKSITITYNVE